MSIFDIALIVVSALLGLQLLTVTGVGLILYYLKRDAKKTGDKLDAVNKVVDDTLVKTKQSNIAAAGILELDV